MSCRVNHLERDNNQKRSLVESQRIKLKAFQDSGKAHDDAMVSGAPGGGVAYPPRLGNTRSSDCSQFASWSPNRVDGLMKWMRWKKDRLLNFVRIASTPSDTHEGWQGLMSEGPDRSRDLMFTSQCTDDPIQ